MNNKVHNVITTSKKFISKHSPEILTGLGLASMVTSTILAVKATPKAVELIQKEEYERKGRGYEILWSKACNFRFGDALHVPDSHSSTFQR